MKNTIFLLFLLLLTSQYVEATHNRAGEITFEQTWTNSFLVTVNTYTKATSVPADRDSLQLCWGDGACEWVLRSNGPIDSNGHHEGELIGNNIRYNQYAKVHTYASQGSYTLTMTDPNRNADILNINNGFSDNVVFHLETMLTVLPSSSGTNHSPKPLLPPVDKGNVDEVFLHTPNAFDIDGDSIAYEFIVPKQSLGTDVPLYSYPNFIVPGPDNQIDLDVETGLFTWNAPQLAGEYNIAFLIKEYRNGQLISSIIRDMQITVGDLDGLLPEISTTLLQNDLIINAGDFVQFDLTASDLDVNDSLKWTVSGGSFEIDDAPVFSGPLSYDVAPINGNFTWETKTSHARDTWYQIVFKAEDQSFESQGLVQMEIIRIKVRNPSAIRPTELTGVEWNLFPNPVDEELSMEFLFEKPFKGLNLQMFNNLGQQISSARLEDGIQDYTINTKNLPEGIYFLCLMHRDGLLTRKIRVKH